METYTLLVGHLNQHDHFGKLIGSIKVLCTYGQ